MDILAPDFRHTFRQYDPWTGSRRVYTNCDTVDDGQVLALFNCKETAYPTEIVLVLYFASQYLRGKWSLRVAITLVVLHFVFWEEEIGPTFMALYRLPFKPYLFWVPSGAPIAWMVACISVLVWALYVRQFRARVSVMVPNGNAVFDHND
jgi:hypothetical protein